MKFFNKYVAICLLTLGLTSCDFDLLDNPNAVSPENANINFLMANSYLEFNTFMRAAHNATAGYVRLETMQGITYRNFQGPESFDFIWSQAYSTLIPDLDLAIAKAQEAKLNFPEAAAKLMKAHTIATIVDLFGDVPYSEIGQGTNNLSPKADKGAEIYAAAEKLVDEARAILSGAPATITGTLVNDLYYNSDKGKWLKLANTMKARLMLNQRLVKPVTAAAIADVIGADGKKGISDPADDFQFKYGLNRQSPDARHPSFADAYEQGGPGTYQSNYLMHQMLFGKGGIVDPRMRYYFYRQDCNEEGEDAFTLGCLVQNPPAHYEGYPFCTASSDKFSDPDKKFAGYWGRDHGDGSGIPPDGLKKTAYGVYPCGGKFDADQCVKVSEMGTDGLKGEGIHPIILSSWVKFMLAEAFLAAGDDANAKTALLAATKEHIGKVMAFGAKDAGTSTLIPAAADVDAYVAKVGEAFDASSDKMDVLMREYWIASFGNATDLYNAYRRTCKPANMQPTLEADPDKFPRSLWYPASYAVRNKNATQKGNVDVPVFWDNNQAGCLK
jgi:hypothetical protein